MRSRWAILILLLAGIVSYANTAGNGLFWDDDEFITRNAYIRSFQFIPQWFAAPITAGAGVNSNYYRPLLTASFSLDYHLWGLWPTGYHLENLLWHSLAGILVFVFLNNFLPQIFNQFSKSKQSAINNQQLTMIAFAASLLWLVHPVHVEAVAYANSRGDSMATVFILLSLILWMPPSGWSPVRVKRRFWTSAVTFILALLSKEFAIVTPGLMALMAFIKVRPWRTPRSDLLKLSKMISPHSIIAIAYILLRLTVLNFQNTLNFYGVDVAKVDQQQPFARYATSLPVRLLTFLKVLPIYAGILIWPTDLHMERTVEIATTAADKIVLVVAAVVIVVIFAMFKGLTLAYAKVRPYQIPLFASGWFFISILPVSGIIPISQILAEHFLYLPSIGFFLLLSWIIVSLIQKRIPLLIVFCLLLIPLLSKTIRQNRIWRDPITFYEYTLAHAKPTARVYNNLAMAYADARDYQKAITNYNNAISLGDAYPNPHYNLGNTFLGMGNVEEAEKEYKRALEIDPNFHFATLKLGQLYLDQGKTEEAVKFVCPAFPEQPLCRQSSRP